MTIFVNNTAWPSTGCPDYPGMYAEVWMRKLLFFMLISLDGFYEGPGYTIDWHNVDEEFNEFADDPLLPKDLRCR